MRAPRIIDAMNYIDDDLVSGAVEYRRTPVMFRLFRKPLLKVCACFMVIAAILTAIFLWRGEDNIDSLPFVISAYAMSEDGTAIATSLEEGERIPIDIFETDGGLRGFVVSCQKADDSETSSVTIISNGVFAEESITEISGITNDPTQNYYFYIPGDNESAPYTMSLFRTDKETGAFYQCVITVTQINGSYFAELTEENITERVVR